MARVKSYGNVLREYEYHPEAKCADATGAPCKKRTIGLLGRRHVAIEGFTFIGKKSNKLEEVEEAASQAKLRARVEAPETFRKLDAFSLKEIAGATGLSLAACSRIRAGAKVPHPRHWQALRKLADS
jgi:hypothetical protein